MLKPFREMYGYCRINLPSRAYGTQPGILRNERLVSQIKSEKNTHFLHYSLSCPNVICAPFVIICGIQPDSQPEDFVLNQEPQWGIDQLKVYRMTWMIGRVTSDRKSNGNAREEREDDCARDKLEIENVLRIVSVCK